METTPVNNQSVDDILRDLGSSTSSPQVSPVTEQPSGSYFSDDDLNDILSENGVNRDVGNEEAAADASSNLTLGDLEELNEVVADATNTQEEDETAIDAEDNEDDEPDNEEAYERIAAENEATAGPSPDSAPAPIENSNTEEEVNEVKEEEVKEKEEKEDKTAIPLNSPTLLISDTTSRFSGAEWFNEIQKQRIIVAGIGGIGSNLVFQLARMVPANITMYDDDIVEMVNMAGQLYSSLDVGKYKVNAMADMIADYTSATGVFAVPDRFYRNTEAGDIMMCGFDNMDARAVFFHAWKAHVEAKETEEEKAKCLFLDGRLSMDTLQILCIKGDDAYNMKRYRESFLFADSDAEETVCSMKQTTYLACMIGSLMVNLFTNFVANLLNPVIPYDLPFFTEYDAPNMLFKTEY